LYLRRPGGRLARAKSWAGGDEVDTYVRVVTFLSRAAGIIGALLIALAVLVICDMVIERYILNLTTIWQIDVVTYSIVGTTFISSAYVLMTRGHVNVDVLPLHVGPTTRYWLALVTMIIGLGFVLTLFVLCTALWYQAWTENWHSDTVWRAPLWIPYFSMPVGLGLLVLQYGAEFISLLTGRSPPFGIKDVETAEDVARVHAREVLGEAP
jgi:TRAP-type C4-dicarboxylate transport system permease small subunit